VGGCAERFVARVRVLYKNLQARRQIAGRKVRCKACCACDRVPAPTGAARAPCGQATAFNDLDNRWTRQTIAVPHKLRRPPRAAKARRPPPPNEPRRAPPTPPTKLAPAA